MKPKKFLQKWQIIAVLMAFYDIVAVFASYFCALFLRFWDIGILSEEISQPFYEVFFQFIPVGCVLTVLIFALFRMYSAMWRYASFNELIRCIGGNIAAAILHALCITVISYNMHSSRMPFSYYIMGFCFQLGSTTFIRFSFRLFLILKRHIQLRKSGYADGTAKEKDIFSGNIMIVGAGEAGRLLLRELSDSKESIAQVKCFIDDNVNKWGRTIDNVPIVGGRDEILNASKKYQIDKILVAIPSASPEARRDILNICSATNCNVKALPSILQLANNKVSISTLKDVQIEDLLGRDTIQVDNSEIFNQLSDQVVLVTGGGGSIGSELCRQIAAHNPKTLIIFDVYENNAYNIQLELKKKFPALHLETLIGSVRDSRRMDSLMAEYRPDIVFHAAAHKHVPLMEDSPCEAIKNNVIGTYKTAYAAVKYGVKRFVLISTDKAVNPTNVMGASKRICEMVIQTFNEYVHTGKLAELPSLFTHEDSDSVEALSDLSVSTKTDFVAVRFGNVLGSNGSVIPLFKRQIEEGGPITVTHPDIIRYFMTIPEAVSLVLQAASYAKGGEIFVLDMGEPVKIDTLARNLIRLSGHVPDEDIKIVYTGLRPGEKLYEEKLMNEEGLTTTPNKLIFIGKPVAFDHGKFISELRELMDIAYRNNPEIRTLVMNIVRQGGGKV